MTPEEQAREIMKRICGHAVGCVCEVQWHPLMEADIVAALAERDRIAGTDEGYLVGWAIKNGWLNPQDAAALRAQRDALVGHLKNALDHVEEYMNNCLYCGEG